MILVTGGTGHIGNVLVKKLLEKGEQVKVIVPPTEDHISLSGLDVEIVYADILDLNSLVENFTGATVVYHLAGIVSIMPGQAKLMQKVNVGGTRNVVEACLKTGVERLIYTSSVHAFDELSHGTVITENTEINPIKVIGDYAKSKALATYEVWRGIEQGLDAIIVHPSGVIGPYEYKTSNTGRLFSRFINGKLLCYVNGGYDFVDVRDVAEGLILACEKGRSGENYILSREWVSLDDIFDLLREITDSKSRTFKVPLGAAKLLIPFAGMYANLNKTLPLLTSYSLYTLRSNSLFSHDKASRELGYNPRPLKETLTDTVKWLAASENMN